MTGVKKIINKNQSTAYPHTTSIWKHYSAGNRLRVLPKGSMKTLTASAASSVTAPDELLLSNDSAGSSDDVLQFFISQQVDGHYFLQLLAVPDLVLHEVRDACVLHLSLSFQSIHIFKWYLGRRGRNKGNINQNSFWLWAAVGLHAKNTRYIMKNEHIFSLLYL